MVDDLAVVTAMQKIWNTVYSAVHLATTTFVQWPNQPSQILTLTLEHKPSGIWAYFPEISVHKDTSSQCSKPQCT
jgi:hypothetical protein